MVRVVLFEAAGTHGASGALGAGGTHGATGAPWSSWYSWCEWCFLEQLVLMVRVVLLGAAGAHGASGAPCSSWYSWCEWCSLEKLVRMAHIGVVAAPEALMALDTPKADTSPCFRHQRKFAVSSKAANPKTGLTRRCPVFIISAMLESCYVEFRNSKTQ
jgi:hypothetical protein